jgi:mono/diheme cytochrome c family protein
MRYFLIAFVVLCALVVGVAGFRGRISRKPPIEVFPDMDRQLKLRPQAEFNFYPDGRSSRLPVEGTVARGSAYEDNEVNTGRVRGSTNFVEVIPVQVTEALLERGQERYQISCAPCHGAAGDGKGITTKYGMAVIADLHDAKTRRLIQQTDGELFNTITHGRGLMGPYGGTIEIQDRWAIVAYVRALQRSRLATVDDVPAEQRAKFSK